MFTVLLMAMVQAVPVADAKEDRKICRRIEQTHTRMGAGRVCKTASQWKLEKQEAEAYLGQKQNQNLEIQTPTSLAAPAPQ